jgi:glycolate oxidase subunit GlcD
MRISPHALEDLKKIVGEENVLTDEASLLLHAYDCSLSRTRPDGLILVQKTEQIPAILRTLHQYKIPFVPRAAATNHAGGCSTLNGGFILNLCALDKILQINTQEGFATVESGAITGELQQQLAKLGCFYAPDPASKRVCTLGGNLAQNASGARCMKYGGTLDHVLEADVVLPDGEEVHLSREQGGPDFLGLIAGSEGTLGIITRLKVKILPLAKHIKTFLVTFASLENSVQTVTDLTAKGIIPRCVEALDQTTIVAVEEFSKAGYPKDAGALLILELDGTPSQISKQEKVLEEICLQNGALKFLPAQTEAERYRLWTGRRAAYAAMARLAPNVAVGDGTVPRSELSKALKKVREILQEYQLSASLLFHAGDGNFHPQIIFDERNKLQTQHVARALKQILQTCVDCGGTVSGEHGIGVEKRAAMAYQYDKSTLGLMAQIKQAIDPQKISNPLKILPFGYEAKSREQDPLPAAVQCLSEKIRKRKEGRLPCTIIGRNTQLKSRAENFISSQGLNKILDIDTRNYTVTAEAGVLLSELKKALKNSHVYAMLPEGEGTLGGLFSSGCLPNFYSQVTGLEALLPDGSFIRYGGKLMKNAAGYNLIRLFAGAQGSLGLVTKLTFKIFATPVEVQELEKFCVASPNAIWKKIKHQLDPEDLFPALQEAPHA